ncbi:MAG: hypothetical protein JRN15_13035 [Nitrososphaerota archaeon]|nr:hypothetical protein [Nitrososphaerota archaeon]
MRVERPHESLKIRIWILFLLGLVLIAYLPFGAMFFVQTAIAGFNLSLYPFLSQFASVADPSVLAVIAILLSLVALLSIAVYEQHGKKQAIALAILAVVNAIPILFLF